MSYLAGKRVLLVSTSAKNRFILKNTVFRFLQVLFARPRDLQHK